MIASHKIISNPKKQPVDAVLSVIEQTRKEFAEGAQAVHIIFANLIYTKNMWVCATSVFIEPIRDDDYDAAIIFGHLPRKYEEYYYDILPEVDNLNLIEDDEVWQDVKYYLLDLYFYQAVHFEKLERITETGGGYFKETVNKKEDNELDEELTLDFGQENENLKRDYERIFRDSFYEAVETEQIKVFREKEARRLWRSSPNHTKAFINMLKKEY